MGEPLKTPYWANVVVSGVAHSAQPQETQVQVNEEDSSDVNPTTPRNQRAFFFFHIISHFSYIFTYIVSLCIKCVV